MKRQIRAVRKQYCSLGTLLWDTQNSTFELFCKTKAPNKWKIPTTCWSTPHSRKDHSFPSSPDAKWSLDWRSTGPACTWSLPVTPPLESSYASHPPTLGHIFWRALAHCGLFAWQNNKAILFYFTQSSVSEFLKFVIYFGCSGSSLWYAGFCSCNES